MIQAAAELDDINNELTKSFKNTNYSQWERKKPSNPTAVKPKPFIIPTTSSNSKLPSVNPNYNSNTNNQTKHNSRQNSRSQTPERKCSPYCNHRKKDTHPNRIVYKTKKQLQEEENRRILLRTRIRYIKEFTESLRLREIELYEKNKGLIKFVNKTEKLANEEVDVILRKYEKYQDVKKTIVNKHYEEQEDEDKQLKQLKKEFTAELQKHQEDSDRIEQELKEAQSLNKVLSVYKNQEYPEKLLHIKNLRKTLADNNSLHNQELDNLNDMIKNERNRMKQSQFEITKNISENVSNGAIKEMHDSLKDMANYNNSIKEEIEFYKLYMDNLRFKISQLEYEVDELKNDGRLKTKNVLFEELYKKREICLPDMDVVLDLKSN